MEKKAETEYVVCVNNEDYAVSLRLWKAYIVIPDRSAASAGLRRIIDESGEAYLYPKAYFVKFRPQSAET